MNLIRWASGIASISSVAALILATSAPARSLAVVATLGSGLSALSSSKPQKAVAERAALPSAVSITPLGEQYESLWQIDGQVQENKGTAVVVDLGDRIVVRQTEVQKGAYILELKRMGPDKVSGVWWYLPNGQAQGLFQGTISEDGKTVAGRWNGPSGQGSGQWLLTAVQNPAQNPA